METLFNKDNQLKKWTIIAEYIDNDNMTAYVQNWGWDENQLIRKFKKVNTNGFEKDISENELKVLLQTVIVNFNIIGVYEVKNSFNTDMKYTINPIKTNREEFLKSKGYTIINHCNTKIEYTKNSDKIYTTRALLKLYSDQCKELQAKITALEEDYEKKDDIYSIKTKQLDELNTKYNNIENQFNKLIERYRNGEKEIKNQEIRMGNLKESLPVELKEMQTEYDTLSKEIDDLKDERDTLNSNIKSLNKEEKSIRDSVINVQRTLNIVENEYRQIKTEYNNIQSKYNDLKSAYNELLETVNSCMESLK